MSLASLKKEEIKPTEKTEEIVRPAEKKIEAVSREALEPMIISDRINFIIDKAFLEYLKGRGKKLVVTDVVNLKINDDVDPLLFEEVVEEIYDVLNITAPKHLRPFLETRTRDVLAIRYKDKVSEKELFDSGILGMVSGVTKAVSEVISATLSSVFKGLRGVTISPGIGKKLIYKENLPQNLLEVEIDLSGGALVTLKEGSPSISIYETSGTTCKEGDYSIDIKEKSLYIELSGCLTELRIPKNILKRLSISTRGGYIDFTHEYGAEEVDVEVAGGNAKIKLNNMPPSRVRASVSGGVLNLETVFSEKQERDSEIEAEIRGGLVKILNKLPLNMSAIIETQNVLGGLADIDIDKSLREYRDEKRKLIIKATVIGGVLRQKIEPL